MKHIQRTSIGFLTSIAIVAGACNVSAQPSIEIIVEILPEVPVNDNVFVTGVTHFGTRTWATGYYRVAAAPGPGMDTRSLTVAWQSDGMAWAKAATPSPVSDAGATIVTIDDIAMRDPDRAYAVGSYIRTGSVSPDTFLMEWDGSEWTHLITPGQSSFGAQGFYFSAVDVAENGAVWMGGSFQNPSAGRPTGTVIEYNNGFSRFDGPLISNSAHAIRDICVREGEVWAVGAAGGSASAIGRSYALRMDSSGWQEISPPRLSFGENLQAVVAMSSSDVWASGVYEVIDGVIPVATPLYWHWDGSSWTQFEHEAFSTDLIAYASDDIYGVSDTRLSHWDGTSWTVVADLADEGYPDASLRDLAIVSLHEIMAVGETPSGGTPIAVRFHISSQCLADTNNDGVLSPTDFTAWIAAFNNSLPECDQNGDGACTPTDFSAWINNFNAGCN